MGATTLKFFVPSLGSYEPTNLLVEVATVVGTGGSAGVIGGGTAAAADDDDGDVAVEMVTPFD